MKSKIILKLHSTETFEDLPEIKDVNGNYGVSKYVIAFSERRFYRLRVHHIYRMDEYMDDDDKYDKWITWEDETGVEPSDDIIAWAELPEISELEDVKIESKGLMERCIRRAEEQGYDSSIFKK